MILKPSPHRAAALLVLVGLMLTALVVSVGLPIFQSPTPLQDGVEPAAIGLVCLVLARLIFLESKRLHSVELSDDGVSGFVWHRKPFPWFMGLQEVTIGWPSVRRIAIDGLSVLVENSESRITVNTQLFRDSATVLEFINRYSKSKETRTNDV